MTSHYLRSILAVLAAAVLAPSDLLAQVRLIEPGLVNQIQLEAGSITVQPAIDIPANARHLRIDAVSSNGADIDLLLRYGEPFPLYGNASDDNGEPAFGGTGWLYEHAHYISRSTGPSESLVVTPYQKQPLRPGRWYVALVNYHSQATRIDITASVSHIDPEPAAITVDFNDAAGCAAQVPTEDNGGVDAWFDSQSAAPVGGNPGTTLGEQRRNAFNDAMEQIRRQVRPIVPIHIRACWADLGGDSERATLASAAPYLARGDNLFGRSNRFGHLPGLEKPYTWHAMAAAAQAMGTESCRYLGLSCTLPRVDVIIQFNREVGSSAVLDGRNYYYGYDTPPPQAIDFTATTMHEIIHGLGFAGTLNMRSDSDSPIGAKFRALLSDNPPVYEDHGHDDAYTDAVVVVDSNGQAREINRMTNAERAAGLVSGNALRWSDPAAATSHTNPWGDLSFPANLPRLWAPDPLEPGSSLSHLNRSGQMMHPMISHGARDMGLAAPMLSAVGWNTQRIRIPTPEPVFPYGGQWYDPARNGHGIDLQRVVGTADTYFLILYTYDANGHPEWFTSVGRVVDGVFRPGNNADGNSLWRWRGPGVLDPDIGGQVRIDFANARRTPECDDGAARAGTLAAMDFSIRGPDGVKNHRWCLTQLLPSDVRPEFDTTGTWYAGEEDSGWGISTLALPSSTGVGLNAIVYLFDEHNQPRWVLGETSSFEPGVAFDLHRYNGYCRECEPPDGGITRNAVGSITIDVRPPQGSSGTVSMDFMGFSAPLPPPNGRILFNRSNSPMILLGESEPAGD